MKKNSLYLIISTSMFISSASFSASMNTIPNGSYSYTQKGDELIGGQKASINWNIMIKDSSNAVVTISSWHAPFTCEGSYIISSDKDTITLSWSKKENRNSECTISPPQILMKKSPSGNILINSKLFPWGNEGWKTVRKTR